MSRVASYSRLIAATTLLIPALLCAQERGRGRKYKPPPPTCNITVTVTKAVNGKPLENAAVIFHPIDEKGKDQGGMELKTDENGQAKLNVIPIGDLLRLQVIAPGFQTFGNDYHITKDSKEIAIKLRYPAQQYSIYQKYTDTEVGGPKVEEKRARPAGHQPPGTTE